MTNYDFQTAPYGLSASLLRSTFGSLVSKPNVALVNIACVDAPKYLRNLIPSAHVFHTDTVPAIHSNTIGVFAVEFYDATTNQAHRIRRLYNLVIGMCQSGQSHITDLRHGFFYLQVRTSGSRNISKYTREEDPDPVELMSGILDRLVDDAWEYDPKVYDKSFRKKKAPDEYRLTGLICEKAYVLFDDEITAFIEKNNWR